MAKVFEDNAVSIGIHINKEPEIVNKYGGCTDMGNVSNVVPSIHPKFYIGTRICNHNEGFTTASGILFSFFKTHNYVYVLSIGTHSGN